MDQVHYFAEQSQQQILKSDLPSTSWYRLSTALYQNVGGKSIVGFTDDSTRFFAVSAVIKIDFPRKQRRYMRHSFGARCAESMRDPAMKGACLEKVNFPYSRDLHLAFAKSSYNFIALA